MDRLCKVCDAYKEESEFYGKLKTCNACVSKDKAKMRYESEREEVLKEFGITRATFDRYASILNRLHIGDAVNIGSCEAIVRVDDIKTQEYTLTVARYKVFNLMTNKYVTSKPLALTNAFRYLYTRISSGYQVVTGAYEND